MLGAFLINLRFSSVMVPAPLPRLALLDQKITPALVSFDSLSGIIDPDLFSWHRSLGHLRQLALVVLEKISSEARRDE